MWNSLIQSIGVYPWLFELDVVQIKDCFKPHTHNTMHVERRTGLYSTLAHHVTQGWHRDDEELWPMVMVWANIYPTEIKLPTDEIIKPSEFELVMINNRETYHQSPEVPLEKLSDRCFIAVRINHFIPTDDDLDRFRKALEERRRDGGQARLR